MKRFAFAALLMSAVGSFASGCRSCQSPYDYTSPCADATCASCTACGNGRAGSALSGGYVTQPPYEYYESGDAPIQPPMPAEDELFDSEEPTLAE